jgi:hypothetical protein
MSQRSLRNLVSATLVALFCLPSYGQSSPSWSAGRDSSGRLTVNAGSLGNVTFRSEVVNAYPREAEVSGCVPADRVAYDWTVDGYGGRPLGSCRTVGACSNENNDLAHPVWKDGAYRHVLIKNWNIKNAFKTNISPHVDVTQVLDSPGWGGWFVAQDSSFRNSDDGLVQWQFGYASSTCPAYQGKAQTEFAGVVVQNVTLGQDAAFNADCMARPGAADGCGTGNFLGSHNGPNVGWFINYKTNGWTITLQQRWEKVIVVGNMPDFAFRSDGTSFAFSTGATCSGSPCSFGGRVFGPYPSIEAAIAAGHAEPPFVRLSCSGWADAKNCAAGAQSQQALLPPASLTVR